MFVESNNKNRTDLYYYFFLIDALAQTLKRKFCHQGTSRKHCSEDVVAKRRQWAEPGSVASEGGGAVLPGFVVVSFLQPKVPSGFRFFCFPQNCLHLSGHSGKPSSILGVVQGRGQRSLGPWGMLSPPGGRRLADTPPGMAFLSLSCSHKSSRPF